MDLAFVSNVVYPYVTGGAEKRIHEIGTRLSEDGHRVTVYCRKFWDGPDERVHDGIELRAVAPSSDLYSGDRRSITEAIDFAVRLAVPLARQLRARGHDLVVASVFPYFPVLSAGLSRAGTGAPLVTTWHEVWRDYWDEYLGVLGSCGKFVERVTARVPQHPIAVSEITADRLARIGQPADSIEVVPNGIDSEKIRTAPLPPDEERYDVLFAGRLVPDKNVSTLLDAFDTVADDRNVTLGVIGDGPELERLERQRRSLSRPNRVDLLGFLDDYEDVLGHMRAARVFASPSTREGFGIVFAEAMAADCTVVAADHPQSAADEVIGDAGFLVEPSVGALADTLRRSLDGERPSADPTARAQRYDWDNVAAEAEPAYRRAMTGEW